MHLLQDKWLVGRMQDGSVGALSPEQLGNAEWSSLSALRPDFEGALYQFLIGLLQLAYAPRDAKEWCSRYRIPPGPDVLQEAFAPYQPAFLLESEGPAFLQDLVLPSQCKDLSVRELLIDAGSDSNLYFNKLDEDFGLCERCFAQALLTLQMNAPSGGRGVRTSLRGGGPLTTLMLPVEASATLWQRLWLNVLPLDALNYPPVVRQSDVLPWLAPTRASDGTAGRDTTPDSVHPLQAWWSMSRRIRLDASTASRGVCGLCAARDVRLIRHYQTRHGGTNYVGAWRHPLTPYFIDKNGTLRSAKGYRAAGGYREWVGLVLGTDDHSPDPAQVVSHFVSRISPLRVGGRKLQVRLWCFGYSMTNMKAVCWYDATMPVYAVPPDLQRPFRKWVKQILDAADETAEALHRQIKAAWLKRPGEVGREPAITQSFWQRSEDHFYRLLHALSTLDFEDESLLAPILRHWLADIRQLTLNLFDEWVLGTPFEHHDMARIVRARAALEGCLAKAKAMKPLWMIVNQHREAA